MSTSENVEIRNPLDDDLLSADPLADLLSASDLTHLTDTLKGQALSDFVSTARVELLAKLKALGVSKLSDRQKLATAIAKTSRTPSKAIKPQRVDYDHLTPQGFQIFCHNTTLTDGTSLDNSMPAPEFIIAALEERTGVKRPANAGQCSLHDLNLHFMSGQPQRAGAAAD